MSPDAWIIACTAVLLIHVPAGVLSQIDDEACGSNKAKHLNAESGHLHLSYSSPLDSLCTWHVYSNRDLKVASIRVEGLGFPGTSCTLTYLELYEGTVTATSDLIDRTCHKVELPEDQYGRVSAGPSFSLLYADLSGVQSGHMDVYFEFVSRSDEAVACGFGGPLVLEYWQGQVHSPRPDSEVPIHNTVCRWLIHALPDQYIELEKEQFTDLRSGDRVHVHDGANHLAPHLVTWDIEAPPTTTIISGGPRLYLEFEAGPPTEGQYPVFEFNYVMKKNYMWACGWTLHPPPARLTQGGGVMLQMPPPEDLGNIGLSCTWRIDALPGSILEVSVHNVSLGEPTGSCLEHRGSTLMVQPETDPGRTRVYCGKVLSNHLNTSLPAVLVTLESPVSGRLDSDYFMLNTTATNVTAKACSSQGGVSPVAMRDSPGIISSTGFPQGIPGMLECAWSLEAPSGWTVRLVIEEFSGPCSDASCGFYAYDFDIREEYLLMHIYENVPASSPRTIKSASNIMKLIYNQGNTAEKSFQFRYEFFQDEACDPSQPIRLTKPEGTLTSPNFDEGSYPSNALCRWIIDVDSRSHQFLMLDFEVIDLREGESIWPDYLSVHDGEDENAPLLGRFEGSVGAPPLLATNTTQTFLQLDTDYGLGPPGSGRGFKLRYYITKDAYSELACSDRARPSIMYNQEHNIKSRNYPDPFPRREQCVWEVHVPPEHVTELTVLDNFLGYDTNNCLRIEGIGSGGRKRPVAATCTQLPNILYQVAAEVTRVNFNSSINPYRGFDIKHSHRHQNELACSRNGHPVGVYLGMPGFIYTPEDDEGTGSFPRKVTCRWYFTATLHEIIHISTVHYEIGTDCDKAHFTLKDYSSVGEEEVVRYQGCGRDSHVGRYLGPEGALAEFVADFEAGDTRERGFRAAVEFINMTERACSLGGLASYSQAPGFIVSPNYGSGNYPPSSEVPVYCRWQVFAPENQRVRLVFMDFEVGEKPDPELDECGPERLEILEGDASGPELAYLCGSSLPKDLLSSSSSVFLTLKTPVKDSFKRGFKIIYNFESSPSSVASSQGLTAGLIAGVVVGTLLATIVIFTMSAIMVARQRKRRARAQQAQARSSNPAMDDGLWSTDMDISSYMDNQAGLNPAADIPSMGSRQEDAPPTYGEAMEGSASLVGSAALTSINAPALPAHLQVAAAPNSPPTYDESQKLDMYYSSWAKVLDAHARWPQAHGSSSSTSQGAGRAGYSSRGQHSSDA